MGSSEIPNMDVTLDDKVKPTGVWSQSWSKMPLKSGLRCVAKTFDVTGLQAKRKDEIIKAIIKACNI